MFKEIIASTALAAIAALSVAPGSATALVTVSGNQIGHAARHVAPVSHNAVALRRRSHKNGKRCIAHTSTNSASSPPPPAGGNEQQNNNNNNNNNTPPPNNGGYAGGGKVGLAWAPDVPSEWIANVVTSKVGYVYNWSPWKPNCDLKGAKFAPMLWGHKQIDDFNSLVVPGYSDVILGMNEVNQDGQARMSEGDAIGLWEGVIAPKRWQGYRLGSPSTTSAPNGLEWMRNWMNGVPTKPDFITLHWYDIGADSFKGYVQSFYDAFHLPIWVTEYACTDFSGQGRYCDVDAFTNDVTGWMDSQGFVEAYFQFGFVGDLHGVSDANRMIDFNSAGPTGLGWNYLT